MNKIALLLALVVALVCVGCSINDALLEDLYTKNIFPAENNTYALGSEDLAWAEGYFTTLYARDTLRVGTTESPFELNPGSAWFDSSVVVRTRPGGVSFIAIGHDAITPLHLGTGSFDLTGSAFDNQFTSTTNIFEAEDAEQSNWIVITSGIYVNTTAEIVTYIDPQNVALHTSNWQWDLTNVEFAVTPHPIFSAGAAGHVHADAKSVGDFHIHSYDHTGECLLVVELESGENITHAMCLEVDAQGYSGVEALNIDYVSGDLPPCCLGSIIALALDETGAVSSNSTTEIDFITFATTDSENVTKHAMHVGPGFDSVLTVSGGIQENPDYGYEVTPDVPVDRVNGVAPNGTAFLDTSASDLVIFDADNDYILIGSDSMFEAVEVILASGGNKPIEAEYYYSQAGGNWGILVVADSTIEFQQSGLLTFNAPALWAADNVTAPGGAIISHAYYIKVVRTRNLIGSPPVESYFKTYTSTSLTDFEIRGDGTIRPVEMADGAAPNNSLYFSTTQNKLVYKDSGGVVHDLW